MEDKNKDAFQQNEKATAPDKLVGENKVVDDSIADKPIVTAVKTEEGEEIKTPLVEEKAVEDEEKVSFDKKEAAKSELAENENDDEVAHHPEHNAVVEVESDEHEDEDEYAHDVKEMPDYAHMPIKVLVAEGRKLIENHEINEIKHDIEAIYKAAIHQLDDVRKEKLQNFIEGGGIEMDFILEQPLKREIQIIYKDFKAKRHQYYKKLEEQLTLNLDVKKNIVEAIKELPEAEGIVRDKYAKFRELQDRWKNTGPVPRTFSRELWNNYHFHVDNFYDFLKISDELRELDFKKNLEKKTALCIEAESLAEAEVNAETFKTLQQLHAKWKQVGPVDREHREPMWERFSAATKTIHDKRHEFFKDLRVAREEILERKKDILKRFEEFDLDKLKTHSAWQNAIKKVNQLRDEFKAIGRVNLPGNDEIWEHYREVNQLFNRTKNAFYKALKHEHHENLLKKRDLLAKAEELKDSSDWKETANKLKRIQSDWKKIGYVPKSESDKIWKLFREACNHFFNRLTEHNKELDKEFESNLDAKKGIIERLKAWSLGESKKVQGMKDLKAFISEWKAAGRIPRSAREIENEFNKLLDKHFAELKLNKKEASMIRFENKMHGLVSTDNERQLDREEDHLYRKLEEAKKELVQLENNIQFFAHVDENNPILKEARRNIDRHKEQIDLLKTKIKMLRKISKEGSDPVPSPIVKEPKAETKPETDRNPEENKED